MKDLNFKTLTLTLVTIASITFSSTIKADNVMLPVISKPAVLSEGTQRVLTDTQVAELLPWSKDTIQFLKDLLESSQVFPASQRVEHLVQGIKTVVAESASIKSELFMRYVLNRGLIINEILNNEIEDDNVGLTDVKLKVLISSIQMAFKYSESDFAKNKIEFSTFGLEYYWFLTDMNKSVFDASAQYAIQKTSFEWFQWDLYRNLNNSSYAPEIVKINNLLKSLPTKNVSDSLSLLYIRQMKTVAKQLGINTKKFLTRAKFQTSKATVRNTISVGDNVGDGAAPGWILTVVSIDASGNYVVDSPSLARHVVPSNRIIFQEGCGERFCVGDTAFLNGVIVEIKGIYLDGTYSATYPGDLNPYSRSDSDKYSWKKFKVSAKELFQLEGCSNDVCVGDMATSKYGTTGRIHGLNENDEAMVGGRIVKTEDLVMGE